MNPDDVVVNVSRILGYFPSVTVLSAGHDEKTRKTYFRLGITSFQSLARIANHCNVGANVGLDVCAGGESLRYGKPLDESRLRFAITVPDDDGRGSFLNPPAPLHILGIFLARDLKHLGLLAADDADELQRAWNGVVK